MKFLTKIGICVTGVWTLGFVIIVGQHIAEAGSMNLNEWGDFLAGISAPLALLWLVIGYFQHGEELRLNTKAIENQQEEFRQQVQETARLVDSSQEEVRLIREREQRESRPDIVPINESSNKEEGSIVKLRNRGAEVHDVEVICEGPLKLDINPKEILTSNEIAVLWVSYEGGDSSPFPITFHISCTDLLGFRHDIGFLMDEHLMVDKKSHTSRKV